MRTALFSRNQPGGIFTIDDIKEHPGEIFFVGSTVTGAVNSTGGGQSPDAPLATVDYAIGLCQANRGDTIYLLPGHAETVTATSIALDVAGVRIVGLGRGLKRPTFTFGAAAATITVSAADCSWENCHFVGNFDNIAAAFTLGAAKDFLLKNNTFVDNSASLHFLEIVVTGSTNNAADGLAVVGNIWHGLALAPGAFVSVLGNLDRLLIEDNDVVMAATDDEGHFLTLSSKVILMARIRRNTLFVTGSAGAAVGIFLTGSATTCTGTVARNLVTSLDTTAELIATAGTGLAYFENYYTGTADASGKLWPAADAA